mgnify:CR=1 FL=1
MHSYLKIRNTNRDACPVQPYWRLLMNDHLCTALVVASGDPGTGTAFHEFNGRIWAFRKRNTTSENKCEHSLSQH